MVSNYFDVEKEVAKLKEQTKLRRKRSYKSRVSQLDKYKFELLELRRGGNTIAELKRFLSSKRIPVAHSTVARWVKLNG